MSAWGGGSGVTEPSRGRPHSQEEVGEKRARGTSRVGLFPLPVEEKILGSYMAPRRRRRVERLTNEASWALSWMHGCGRRGGESASLPAEFRDRVRHRVREASLCFPDTVCAPSPEEALKELFKGRSAYDDAGVPAALAPFEHSRVSVPEDVRGADFLEDLLPAEEA